MVVVSWLSIVECVGLLVWCVTHSVVIVVVTDVACVVEMWIVMIAIVVVVVV